MHTPQLSARLYADGLTAVLRVDAIRRDTLIALARAWEDGGRADIEAALDRLADAVTGNPTDGELDAAVQAVEEAGCMDDAEVRITRRAAAALRRQLGAAVWRLSPRPRPAVVQQRGKADAA